MEYGLLGASENPDPRVAATFQGIFPEELMQPSAIGRMLRKSTKSLNNYFQRHLNTGPDYWKQRGSKEDPHQEPVNKKREIADNSPQKAVIENARKTPGPQRPTGTTESTERIQQGPIRDQISASGQRLE